MFPIDCLSDVSTTFYKVVCIFISIRSLLYSSLVGFRKGINYWAEMLTLPIQLPLNVPTQQVGYRIQFKWLL